VPDLAVRVTSLDTALNAGADRFDPDAVEAARTAMGRVGSRFSQGADKTVVALAGATGSGKSTLFNALSGIQIAQAGPRRPTTSEAMACVWGAEGVDELLDWLEVPRRNRVSRETVLDADRESSLHGLVLLDLPDHDSTEVSNRVEVDRLVELVDLLVWVVDPQKYADDALHSRYLKRLSGHSAVMLVVLNQVDKLDADEIEACTRDLRRLLDADGLDAVPLLTTSARHGDGVEELRAAIARAVRYQLASVERAAADLEAAGRRLMKNLGGTEGDPDAVPGTAELVDSLAGASGIPVVLDAVAAGYRRRGSERVAWPVRRWAGQLRRDPLRRLRLETVREDAEQLARAARPTPTPAQRSRVDLAVREAAATASAGLPPAWGEAVKRAGNVRGDELTRSLDEAVLGVELPESSPAWWSLVWGVQMLLAWVAGLGLFWLVGLFLVNVAAGGTLPVPSLGPVPWALIMAAGALGLGAGLGSLAVAGVATDARRRREVVADQFHAAVGRVAQERVVAPIGAVLRDHRIAREALEPVPAD
jgi:GTP-binding protein EngB required for normal cell division